MSTTTLQLITGNPPSLLDATIDNFKDNIYFSIVEDTGAVYELRPGSDDTMFASLSTIIRNITPKLDGSFLTNNDIDDTDGDILSQDSPYTIIDYNYVWKNKKGEVIDNSSSSNLGGNICIDSSTYPGPYTLDLLFNIKINTQYGLPYESEVIPIAKTLTVNADDGICYARPGVLGLNVPSGWPDGDDAWGLGRGSISRTPSYDETVFVPRKGFKAWVSQKFPTTAFPEARFQIVPYKDLSNYTITLKNNPGGALVDQQQYAKGQFKFGATMPDRNEIYSIEVKSNTYGVSFYYNFKLQSSRSWFDVGQKEAPTTGQYYTTALARCGEDHLPTRAEITNSVYANTPNNPINAYIQDNGFMRTIGNLMAEWGMLYYYAPASTKNDKRDMMRTVTDDLQTYFAYWYYWTKDLNTANRHLAVGVVEGNIAEDTLNEGGAGVFCIY
ncbi:hypothetical protein [Orbus hercynius]|uniref:hypothetical protein n=1 Tax=Orbus hercynius TaxID=593135 RepID=UPI0011C4535F|nr:hypothetical protein [Orbus hercynius]